MGYLFSSSFFFVNFPLPVICNEKKKKKGISLQPEDEERENDCGGFVLVSPPELPVEGT